MFRVVLDANVYLSYLVAVNRSGKLVRAVDASLKSNNIDLLVPHGLLQEIKRIAETKAYFKRQINEATLRRGIEILVSSSLQLPYVEASESYSRDANDDYLIASALEHQADYIVSGDKDLLVLGYAGAVSIIPPAEYFWLLDAFDLLQQK